MPNPCLASINSSVLAMYVITGLLLSFTSLTLSLDCPGASFPNAAGDGCFHFSHISLPFADSEEKCREVMKNFGYVGHLASILDIQEQHNLSAKIKTDFWIGGITNRSYTQKWFWLNGREFSKANLQGLSKEPALESKNCLKMDEQKRTLSPWNCGTWLPFLCEFDPKRGALEDKNPRELFAERFFSFLLRFQKEEDLEIGCKSGTISNATVCRQFTRIELDPCEHDWKPLPSTNSCYRVFHSRSFQEASSVCNSFNAKLTSIHGKQEHDFVVQLVANGLPKRYPFQATWIGGRTSEEENVFKWVDHTDWDFEEFVPSGTNICVSIYVDHEEEKLRNRFHELDCDLVLENFVCKKPADKSRLENYVKSVFNI
ncbi:hypothetical protein L596_014167 [Steinernema carpocapsae]|uniref:C-type lectin domain-containing protein n=1 Tax=Steinernema carpocapsae TaxID=34508 RepID=A0A4U5NC90_STECR|nr:hypothetical protein L596_014167 [Steinernema carpocapsae]